MSEIDEFDRLLGSVTREIVVRNLPVMISTGPRAIHFDFYNKSDVFNTHYTEVVFMGNVATVKRLLDYIKNSDFNYKYKVKYKEYIFNINEQFSNLHDAQEYCDKINEKFNLELKVETICERVKENKKQNQA